MSLGGCESVRVKVSDDDSESKCVNVIKLSQLVL